MEPLESSSPSEHWLSETKHLGKSTNSLAAAAKVARRALDELHFRSTANASERIGMDGDTEVTEILQRARDGTSKDKDGGVVNCALVFAAHYGLLDHVIDILKKCPPHVIPALLNCTASFYEPLAPPHQSRWSRASWSRRTSMGSTPTKCSGP